MILVMQRPLTIRERGCSNIHACFFLVPMSPETKTQRYDALMRLRILPARRLGSRFSTLPGLEPVLTHNTSCLT